MLTRYLKLALATAVLLGLFSCQKDESDNSLVEIAVRQDRQGKRIAKLATKIGGLERMLAEIRGLARSGPRGSGEVGPGGAAVDFRNTPEYEQMAAAILAIQQQLNITQSEVAETKDTLEKQPELAMRGPRRRMASTVGNRRELSDKLDSIAAKFAEIVEDPLLEQNLMAEVEQFKQELSDDRPAGELYQPLVANLTQRVESEQNAALRRWGEKCLKALEAASEDNLATRVQEGTDFQNALRLRDLINNNQIPQDVLKELGLDKLVLTRTNDTGTGGEAMGIGPMGLSPEGPPISGGGDSSGGPRMDSSTYSHSLSGPGPVERNP